MAELDHLTLLEHEVAATTAAFAGADADAPVAACPGWTVRDVARHVTTLHRWVTAALDSPTMPDFDERPADGDAKALAADYADAGGVMVARMRELPADHSCWSFDRDNQKASFWYRRQLHELSVHRFDLAGYELDDEIAADGIDEAIHFMLPRMVKAGRATLPEGSLELVSPHRTWTIGEGEPLAVAQGSASDLLMSLWGRADLLPTPWRDAKMMP